MASPNQITARLAELKAEHWEELNADKPLADVLNHLAAQIMALEWVLEGGR